MKLTKYIFSIIAVFIALFLVAYLGLFRAYISFVLYNILYPLGVNKLPEPLGGIIGGIVANIPMMVGMFAWHYYRYRKQEKIAEEQVKTPLHILGSARKSLAEAISYMNKLEQNITLNVKKSQELSDLVDTLDSVSKEKVEELRKKLKAIEYLNRSGEYKRTILAFMLGVISSLIASAIWSLIAK
jgi:hypothetical protein